MHYGQLSQAAYDRLGLEPCERTWGNATLPPSELLAYLTRAYPLEPEAEITDSTPPATKDVYVIPRASDGLSPLIYARAGAGVADVAVNIDTPKQTCYNWLQSKVAGIPATLIGGSRPLFKQEPRTGRGLLSRSAFMGFVAVSQPPPGCDSPDDSERDAVFVWRGTIFKEEWEANFGQDKLVQFNPKRYDDCPTAWPWHVGVHDGFHDLYMRPAEQPDPAAGNIAPPHLTPNRTAPRKVVGEWLKRLQRDYNITTVTTTGHSLGGALSTLSAYDVALQLRELWRDTEEARAERTGWKTRAMPTVTAVAFAPPRVGNFTFLRRFSDELRIRELRVCNKPDFVPMLPGLWVQLQTWRLSAWRIYVYKDMDSLHARCFGWAVHWLSIFTAWIRRWGYFHVGTILEINSREGFVDRNGKPLGKMGFLDFGSFHNLEVYLHFLEKMGLDATGRPLKTSRNPLLLNKGADILLDKRFPADWWRAPAARNCEKDHEGRWRYVGATKPPSN